MRTPLTAIRGYAEALADGLVFPVRSHEVREVLRADEGRGLTAHDAAHAFDRGLLRERYRDVRAVGSGLGLSIAARLVQRSADGVSTPHGRHRPSAATRIPITVRVPSSDAGEGRTADGHTRLRIGVHRADGAKPVRQRSIRWEAGEQPMVLTTVQRHLIELRAQIDPHS